MPNNLAKKRANKKIKRLKRNNKNKQHPLIDSVDNANSLQFNKNLADSRFKTEMKKKHGISFQYGTSNIKMSEVILDFADETLNKIDDFKNEISSARTFCFLHELEKLLENNLIQHFLCAHILFL